MKKVLLVEDHAVVMEGFRIMFERSCSGCQLETVSSIANMMKALQRQEYAMVILDIQLEDGLSINILPDVLKLYPELNILMFTGYSQELYAQRLLKLGVKGFLSKHSNESEIVYALRRVLDGKMYLGETSTGITSNKNGGQPLKDNPFSQLSQREMEIALLLLQGKRSTFICQELNLHPSTVTTHKIKILTKLEVDNVVDMQKLATLYQVS